MLEESSMNELLKMILPRVLPEGVQYYLAKHEGKQDLDKPLQRELKAILRDARFIIVPVNTRVKTESAAGGRRRLRHGLFMAMITILATNPSGRNTKPQRPGGMQLLTAKITQRCNYQENCFS